MAKSGKIEVRPCTECAFSHLMQWNDDPVVAECTIDESRWVAKFGSPACINFKPYKIPPHTEHINKI